uniref:Tc1-like transposase DDE domain-containing protein n=1 Tax=Poecilia mexicana TaxID=48701 RepID=A0A3B3XHK0_9TELE
VFHHDNAPAHTAISVTTFMARNGMAVLPHPPYSPDMIKHLIWHSLMNLVTAKLIKDKKNKTSMLRDYEASATASPQAGLLAH